MKRILLTIVVTGLFVFGITCFSNANPIIFAHTGSGAGSIDGANFTTSDFTITSIGDTDDRTSFGTGYSIGHLSATIDITGVGTFDFVTGTRTFVNNFQQTVGFSLAYSEGGSDLVEGPTDSSFATWDMLSSIGPIGGTAYLLQWTDINIITNGGILVFDDQFDGISATFQAEVASVPEPATMLLLGTSLVGVPVLPGEGKRIRHNRLSPYPHKSQIRVKFYV